MVDQINCNKAMINNRRKLVSGLKLPRSKSLKVSVVNNPMRNLKSKHHPPTTTKIKNVKCEPF